MSLGTDPHSYSNFKEIRVTDLSINLTCDYKRRIFHGYVDLTCLSLADHVQELLLDCKALAIEAVEDEHGNPLEWTVPKTHFIGFCLRVALKSIEKSQSVKIRVRYSTTALSGGIQWFSPEQTAGGKHPYVYTQCEAILARTLVPCQDTPAVKAPYSISVTVPAPLKAVCSGEPVGNGPVTNEDGSLTFSYRQNISIPAYLIAIAAGALVSGAIGPRSVVYTEKELLAASVWEFSDDTEAFIKAGEAVCGVSYDWGRYDIVILPGSFPYGGMENPNLTFFSPCLLAGDKSLTNVLAHEITHSWAGNYVTNSSWSDFWLNEGFTVYIERLILGHVNKSEAYRHFEILVGYKDLIKTVNDVGASNEYTKLRPNLTGVDPDDAFSKVPYEKGSLFLLFLEQKVGGPARMQSWLKKYFTDFRGKSLASEQMKQHFESFFSDVKDLATVDWNVWFYGTGLPPFNPETVLDTSLTLACNDLAKSWQSVDGDVKAKEDDLKTLKAKQIMYFLDVLITASTPFPHDRLDIMNSLYRLSSSPNVEILFRWIMLCIKSNYTPILPQAADFLSKYGRGLYVRPMYKALDALDHDFAAKTFIANRPFYHSVITTTFDHVFLKK
eukprot:CAMPEP_0184645550 /NCGR_PEP_ID=MMETSP0308-20130426/2074_1 /TAXON_ID=38269 /ORGANISM="Gloeochaete witrockiana, Strain SAG 46.84" /LENGTH=610 /DNA_ID=CAMNT_0027074703 /DNA_START=61 /DNA_END=1893 /DNA_ORIENTATION=-